MNKPKPKQKSPIFCAHANEVPYACPCPEDCYCKANTCSNSDRQPAGRQSTAHQQEEEESGFTPPWTYLDLLRATVVANRSAYKKDHYRSALAACDQAKDMLNAEHHGNPTGVTEEVYLRVMTRCQNIVVGLPPDTPLDANEKNRPS